MENSKVVWKFALEHVINDIIMPWGAMIVHMALQGDTPTIWAEVNMNEHRQEERRFYHFVTGALVPKSFVHIGTYIQDEGRFVGHIYERA